MVRMKWSTKIFLLNALTYGLLGIVLIAFIFPIFWMYITSFKPAAVQVKIPPVWIFEPTLESYVELFKESEFATGMQNTLIVAPITTVIVTLLGSLAGYSLARVKWRGRDTIAIWILSMWMFPLITVMVPLFMFFNELRLIDTYPGLIFIYTFMNLPLAIWLMRGFFMEIPTELDEAAMVDGYSRWGAFFKVVLPIAISGMITTALLVLILTWNEFLAALILSRSRTQTATVVMSGFVGRFGARFGWIVAAGCILSTPIFILAVIIQRHLVRGLTFGAVRG